MNLCGHNFLSKSRRKIIFSLSLLLLIVFSVTSCNKLHDKPNVILLIVDDLSISQIGSYGSMYYETPHIDRLAQEGLRFTNAYAAAAVCSPARAAIMTGKYPARLHLTNFIPGDDFENKPLKIPNWQKSLPLAETTIAEVAKKQHYGTAFFGKWNLSRNRTPPKSLDRNPDKHGFDKHFITYKPSKKLRQAWQLPEKDGHNVDTLTVLGQQFIGEHSEKPFLMILAHNTLHSPKMERQDEINLFRNKEGGNEPQNNPVLAAMVKRLDDSIGRIRETLKENNLSENTLIILLSDNGGSYNDPSRLRAGKGRLYEGGLRIPLIMNWPKGIKPNTLSNHKVISMDIFATIANLIAPGTDLQDGINGLDAKSLGDRNSLYWHYPHYHKGSGMKPASAVQKEGFKLIRWYEGDLSDTVPKYELYDLNENPVESNNLAEMMPEKVQALDENLQQWLLRVNAQLPSRK